MAIEFREIARADEALAMRFAALGMNFNRFTSGGLDMRLYARHYWYFEKNRATQCIAAYEGKRLLGVLLARMEGEPARYASFWRKLYVHLGNVVMRLIPGCSEQAYLDANDYLMAAWGRGNEADGELGFLAADPEHPTPGVGTALLAELERREAGKLIYLYTDDACTYQFYEHRGFTREAQTIIDAGSPGHQQPLRCFLYSKRLG